MKKIVPFKKDISFDSEIEEITSISLDHEFSVNENRVVGSFKISGEYKTKEETIEPLNINLPFTVSLDDKYILDNANIDIDDFYYEITEHNNLKVGIDVLIDNLDEKEQRCIEEEIEEKEEEYDNEEYKNYTVYIFREEDTIEKIMTKYSVTKEMLAEYNDINSVKVGDKIIIPSI